MNQSSTPCCFRIVQLQSKSCNCICLTIYWVIWAHLLEIWAGWFNHGRLARWRWWSACDVGEATLKGLDNEQSLIRQPFRRLTYVTAHSPILPASLHLRHRHFTYVTCRAAHGFNWQLRKLMIGLSLLNWNTFSINANYGN